MSGSEVHANIVATLIDEAFLHVPGRYFSLLMMVVLGVFLGWFSARVNLIVGACFAVIFHFGWKLLVAPLLFVLNWEIPIIPILLMGALIFSLEFLYRWIWLGTMFGLFKSSAVIRALQANPDRLDFQRDCTKVTVLFADIRDFTAYSNRNTAETVVNMLNAYFGVVVPILERQGGILNQYLGDGIMVLFGAPKHLARHEYHALCAAVEIVKRVHQLARDQRWQDTFDFPDVRIGVGIHTGEVILGTIGSTYRKDYTAVGDTVNIASRIEGLNKLMGTEILISSETYKGLSRKKREILGCDLEPTSMPVKGKDIDLLVHKVVQHGWTLKPSATEPTTSSDRPAIIPQLEERR